VKKAARNKGSKTAFNRINYSYIKQGIRRRSQAKVMKRKEKCTKAAITK